MTFQETILLTVTKAGKIKDFLNFIQRQSQLCPYKIPLKFYTTYTMQKMHFIAAPPIPK